MADIKRTDAQNHKLATEAAMFLAGRLKNVGIEVRVIGTEHADAVKRSSGEEEFSVADMQKASYVWNGDEVSLAAFARAFMSDIKSKDRTVEDANRIAEAYIKKVAEDPSKHIPALFAENMSHARYFILRDGTVFGPLQSVGEDLYVYEGATLQTDALQSVGGYVKVYRGATLQADAVQSVGGSVNVYEGATLQADVLQSVGVYVNVYEYDEYYEDSDGNLQPLIDPKTVIMQSSRERNIMLHGAVTYLDQRTNDYVTDMAEYVPYTVSSYDPPVKKLIVSSRVLPMPRDVDSWLVLKNVV